MVELLDFIVRVVATVAGRTLPTPTTIAHRVLVVEMGSPAVLCVVVVEARFEIVHVCVAVFVTFVAAVLRLEGGEVEAEVFAAYRLQLLIVVERAELPFAVVEALTLDG